MRDGKPFDNSVVGHYVYRVAWSPDGRELLFNRTNRRQQILEFTAADPDTGACRAIVREEWPTGWVMNSPPMMFLKDGKRFIWESERNGWRNLYPVLRHPDNNVHPSNTMQLIAKLQEAGKSFEVQLGPDKGHSGINQDRMMEFFIENLITTSSGRGTASPAGPASR